MLAILALTAPSPSGLALLGLGLLLIGYALTTPRMGRSGKGGPS